MHVKNEGENDALLQIFIYVIVFTVARLNIVGIDSIFQTVVRILNVYMRVVSGL